MREIIIIYKINNNVIKRLEHLGLNYIPTNPLQPSIDGGDHSEAGEWR